MLTSGQQERKSKQRKIRNSEYYDMEGTFDRLYAESKKDKTFNHLMEIIESEENIKLAYRTIKKNTGSDTSGVDKRTIADLAKLSEEEYVRLIRKQFSSYHPRPVRRVEIPKPNGKTRPLGIPTIVDRIIQQCILQVMEPICEAKFSENSNGFRPNRSAETAIAQCMRLIQVQHAAQSLYEQKLITYPRTDSQYLTSDMEETAKQVIRKIHEKYQLLGPFDQPKTPEVKKVLNDKKVSDHHAIIPTIELAEFDFSKLREWEQKILFLIAVHTVEAMEEDHVFMETEVEVRCQDEIFKAKGKVIKQIGWKLYEECFKNDDGLAIENPADAGKEHIPKVEADHKFYNVSAAKTEHFTAPLKPYSEDTLLAAMETAGNKEFDEDTEKKGLGTPATRAGIIEKLIASQYAVRKGKQILPTEDGIILIDILPDFLKSATMTAEWENQLLEMEHGKMAPGQFMTGIEKLISMMLNHCDSIPEEETRRFQKKESLGTCPVCGGLVYEGKKNFYCGNRECNFCLWKENKYLQSMEKDMDTRMAAELLKNGSVHVKDLYSRKKDLYFEADLHMEADENGRVTFSLSFPKKKTTKKNKRK